MPAVTLSYILQAYSRMRGLLQCIGATTAVNYSRHVLSNVQVFAVILALLLKKTNMPWKLGRRLLSAWEPIFTQPGLISPFANYSKGDGSCKGASRARELAQLHKNTKDQCCLLVQSTSHCSGLRDGGA